jgi:thiamine pyrophosphate-dependent acetolactate synthase large subunit-like protein
MGALMRRSDAAALVRERLDARDIVVCSLGSTARAWREQRPSHLTYFASDPMGTAPALALGLALARPDRRVVLLEGDGDLAMNLGVLVTIAGAMPKNLRIAVFTNARYETGGGQPLPGPDHMSFAVIASGAGFPWTGEGRDEKQAAKLLDHLLERDDLGLIALHVEPEPSPYPADPGPTSQAEDRAAFQKRLNDET